MEHFVDMTTHVPDRIVDVVRSSEAVRTRELAAGGTTDTTI